MEESAAAMRVRGSNRSRSSAGRWLASRDASGSAQLHLVSELTVLLAPRSFVAAWLALVTLHVACAVYLTQLARLCAFLTHPRLVYWSKLATGDRYVYLHHASVVIGLIGALHYWQLACILYASVRARALAFPDKTSGVWSTVIRLARPASRRTPPASETSKARVTQRPPPTQLFLRLWQLVFSRHGIFGIESRAFHAVFTLREVVEIVSQTFQARRSSDLLPRPWLNNLFVALVVLNCWSTPIIHRVFWRHEGQERVVCLVLDALLNMGSSMVVPLAVFWPYYETFIPERFFFPVASVYSTIWFSKTTMETQLLFSMATLDVFSKLVPHIGIYASLAGAATLLQRQRVGASTVRAFSIDGGVSTVRMHSVMKSKRSDTLDHRSAPSAASVVPLSSYSRVPRVFAAAVRSQRKQQLAVHAIFVLWGLAVLALHVHALTRLRGTSVVGCRQSLNAWFARGYPCSVYNYNCYRHGVASPDEDAWTHLDTKSLAFITVSHCSALTVPRALQRFTNLVGFHLHNVTVVEWSRASAISAAKHPALAVLLIARMNTSALPDGMTREPLPDKLINMQISHTNLTALPDDLHTRWHALVNMYVEHSLLTTFPRTLQSLPFDKLSLHGNHIAELPALSETRWRTLAFAMNANPLTHLPDAVADGTAIAFFSAEGSQLATLPQWVRSSIKDTIYLHGTPYCKQQQRDKDVRDGVLIACETRDDRVTGKVPIGLLDTQFPV